MQLYARTYHHVCKSTLPLRHRLQPPEICSIALLGRQQPSSQEATPHDDAHALLKAKKSVSESIDMPLALAS